jgi:hypothetical protein
LLVCSSGRGISGESTFKSFKFLAVDTGISMWTENAFPATLPAQEKLLVNDFQIIDSTGEDFQRNDLPVIFPATLTAKHFAEKLC